MPAGKRLYVSDQGANALHVIETHARTIERSIALGESPEGVSVSADGLLTAAATEAANAVALIDAASGNVLATVKTEDKNPEHAVFSPDGRWLYVSAEDASQIDVVDVGERRQMASIPVARRPRGIAFTPDGKRAYVACELDSRIYPIDVDAHRAVAEIRGGNFSNGVVMSPDGARRLHFEWTRRESYRHRHGQQRGTRDGTGRAAAMEHGDYPGRGEGLCRQRTRTADIAVGELPWGVVIR